jgi:hypothetical protein
MPQLSNMAKQAKEVIGADTLDVVADRGYYKGEILACDEAGITSYLPRPDLGQYGEGYFGKRVHLYRRR